MEATYYAIKETSTEDIVLEGIIKNSEDTIYPQQETGIEKLPYECEVHHFKVDGYKIEICDFIITREFVKQNRISGSKL